MQVDWLGASPDRHSDLRASAVRVYLVACTSSFDSYAAAANTEPRRSHPVAKTDPGAEIPRRARSHAVKSDISARNRRCLTDQAITKIWRSLANDCSLHFPSFKSIVPHRHDPHLHSSRVNRAHQWPIYAALSLRQRKNTGQTFLPFELPCCA